MSASVRDALAVSGGRPPAPAVPGNLAEFAVEPNAGILEAANAQALILLRLPGGIELPVALDTAMPALRRLREIGAEGATPGDQHLKLWCAGRLVRVSAKVFEETMSDGHTRLVVRALHEEATREPSAKTGSLTQPGPAMPAPAANDTGAPETNALPVQRDDRETLREIARRIREGHKPVSVSAASDATAAPAAHVDLPPPFAPPAAPGAREEGLRGADAGTALPLRDPVQVPGTRALSKIAHEIRTPLSAIVAAAEVMRDEQLGPMGNAKYLGYAGDIYESARHALDVVNAMLTGDAREARSIGPVDLAHVAVSTVSVMQPLARSSGIALEPDCGDERLEVTGDATAIRQIIYNLISNALKFTPQGGEVHVVTGYLPKGIPFFVVRDTGEGMSEDDIVRAFYRDDSRIGARKGGGYGIGLPMVRKLAEMMNATIDVDSEPGKGTVVLVSFPDR